MGLAAFAQSNATGMIGDTPRYGFLKSFVIASSDFQDVENDNTVTPFGQSLGLVDSDVDGNFSHSFFTQSGPFVAVDLLNGDASRPLSLALRGVIPEPSVFALLLGGVPLTWRRRRR